MRRLITILLLAAVVALQLGSRWIVYAAFKANQAYIARELCENKAKPEIECNGQCHLKKELRKTAEQERKVPRPAVPELAAAPMPERTVIGAVALLYEEEQAGPAYAPFEAGMPQDVAGGVWRPPGV